MGLSVAMVRPLLVPKQAAFLVFSFCALFIVCFGMRSVSLQVSLAQSLQAVSFL